MRIEEAKGAWWAWDPDAGACGVWVTANTREEAVARFERALEFEERIRKELGDERKTQP